MAVDSFSHSIHLKRQNITAVRKEPIFIGAFLFPLWLWNTFWKSKTVTAKVKYACCWFDCLMLCLYKRNTSLSIIFCIRRFKDKVENRIDYISFLRLKKILLILYSSRGFPLLIRFIDIFLMLYTFNDFVIFQPNDHQAYCIVRV